MFSDTLFDIYVGGSGNISNIFVIVGLYCRAAIISGLLWNILFM